MPEFRFRNSWTRIKRATEHIEAFQTEWNAVAKGPFTTIATYDEDSAWYTASLTAEEAIRERIRNTSLPLILGEYAYQLRAALDGLIWDAITFTQGSEPPADATRVEFPILNGKTKEFDKCGFLKFPFPDKLKDWLESIQPGSTEKPLGDPDRGLANALEDVHNLARFDRHRRLRIVAAFPSELYVNVIFEPAKGFKAVDIEGLPCNILGDEYDLLRFKVASATDAAPDKILIETGAKFEIFFEDIAAVQDMPPGERLGNLLEAVGHITRRFEAEFAM